MGVWIFCILINNAGIQTECPSHELSADEFDRVLDINLRGAFLCARETIKHLFFLYCHVFQQELDNRINAIRAKRLQQIPIVLSPEDAFAVINSYGDRCPPCFFRSA